MKYNKSELHLANLAKARETARRKTEECSFCKELFSKSGIAAHTASCKKRKPCPVCGSLVKGKNITCSHACANSFFRSNDNHPNWKPEQYKTTCFLYHERRCIICDEFRIVEVHHADENKSNNKPENLVPLCPTHHQYWHSKHRNLIESRVRKYVEGFSGTKRLGHRPALEAG